jgi:hypothetical protein
MPNGSTRLIRPAACCWVGQLDRSADLYARVRDIQDRADTAGTDAVTLLHNLAGLAYSRMDYPQAETCALAAVARRRATSGAHAVEVAADLAVLAAAVSAQHRHDKARAAPLKRPNTSSAPAASPSAPTDPIIPPPSLSAATRPQRPRRRSERHSRSPDQRTFEREGRMAPGRGNAQWTWRRSRGPSLVTRAVGVRLL